MEVLPPSDPAATTAAAAAATAAAISSTEDQPSVQSPRTSRLVTHLLQRVLSLNRKSGGATSTVVAEEKDITVMKKCPYSAVEKNPGCPYVFQMPLHYPRYSKEEYERMPEWQLDRLLEEYGLPVSGSLSEKREYVIGAFVWGGR